MDGKTKTSNNLIRHLSPLGVWALAFGCSVGWGAFVMPGTTFLPIAGPIGTVIGILIGAAIMLLIGFNYFYLMKKFPDAGGTYSFTKNVFGYDHGFLSAWFMGLVYLAIIWANSTALPLIFRCLFGDLLQFGYLYSIAGYNVYIGELLLSLSSIVLFSLISLRGGKITSLIQITMALILIAGVVIGFSFIFFKTDSSSLTFKPAFSENYRPVVGSLFIVFLAPWAFAGFESISHSTEEFKFPVKKTIAIMVGAILSAAIAYIFLALIGASSYPEGYDNWFSYVSDLGSLEGVSSNPVFNGIANVIGVPGLIILGVAAGAAIITGLVGNSVAASRMIYSMAKDSLLPEKMGKLNNYGVPKNAILFLMIISLPIPFLGRSAIGWVVDINTIGVIIAYMFTSLAALKVAISEHNKKIITCGIIGISISIFFLLYFLVPNKWSVANLATESYLMLLFWIVIGFVAFYLMFKRDKSNRMGRNGIVWIVMMLLLVFTSFVWIKKTIKNYSQTAIAEISSASEAGYAEYGITQSAEEKNAFLSLLTGGFDKVSNALLLNSLLVLIIIVIALFVIFTILKNVRQSHESAVEEKMIAEQSSSAKTTFLSNMSHDIRTPMNAIIGYVTLAKKDKDLSPSTIEYLSKIESSSDHLLALINDVLEMSRIESGKMELAPIPCDLNILMSEVKSLFDTQMKVKDIDYQVNCNNLDDPYVICDFNRLNRVLLNLISNAYKFTNSGGYVKVDLTEEKKEDDLVYLCIKVADNGIGMSEEFAKKVFDAYERERTSTVENIQGTGLGTAITKRIVDMMNGTIDVETEKGKGTTFTIHLAFPVDSSHIKKEEKDSLLGKKNLVFSGMNLLLVEDDLDNMNVAKSIFEDLGFSVVIAVNGEEGAELIASSTPGTFDVVIMDIEMPIKNGIEATKLIRSFKNASISNIPIIALSARAFSEDIAIALDAGMDGYIAKPINVDILKQTLSDVLLK